jgi:hypothetical protein
MMYRQSPARVATYTPEKAGGCKCGTCAKCRKRNSSIRAPSAPLWAPAVPEAERGHRWRHDFSRIPPHGPHPMFAMVDRSPDADDGVLDREGERRQKGSTSTSPSTSGTGPPFVCGVDVTVRLKDAVADTKSYFYGWDDDEREEVCESLHSLWTGDVAWDIIEMHAQVTKDVLNNAHRPPCATSGAKPACGSSVTVDGFCHFAGSANYVIFGVMCKLCFHFYERLLKNASFFSPTMGYLMGKAQFTKDGMLGLIDLYKKYVPLITGSAPAANIKAAKHWSIAGYQLWPAHAKTPAPDRANCDLTCPVATKDRFNISWYPHLNKYKRRRGVR